MTRGIEFSSGSHKQDIDTIYPEEIRGSYEAHYTSAAGAEVNSFEIEGPMDIDAMVWWANIHMKSATPTGAGGDRTWTFLPTLTSDDQKSATIQFGYTDTIGASNPGVSIPYCLGNELTLMWEKAPGSNGATFKSSIISPKTATQITAFTGTGTYTTSELAKAGTTVITIDPTTIGTTTDNDIVSVEWTYKSGYVNLYTLNNTYTAQDAYRPNPLEWELKLKRYIRNDNEWDRYVDKAKRKIRIKSTGSVLGASFYSIALDCYGTLADRSTTEDEGIGYEELTYKGLYDTTLVGTCQLVIVSALTTIT
jgi:hypothetical protein